jgi:hypothetical protein
MAYTRAKHSMPLKIFKTRNRYSSFLYPVRWACAAIAGACGTAPIRRREKHQRRQQLTNRRSDKSHGNAQQGL